MDESELPTPDENELDALIANIEGLELPKKAWPGNLLKIVDVLAAMWERKGISTAEAEARAKDASIALAHYAGGTQLYLPTGKNLIAAVRHALIFRAYRHRPFDANAVAMEYGITPDAARAIFKKQRALYLESVRPRK